MSPAGRRIALGLFVAAGAFASLLLRGDGRPPEDADLLAVGGSSVPDHENGFLTMVGASELLAWPESEDVSERWNQLARGESWDDGLAAELLRSNAAALAALERAARARQYRSPPVVDARAGGIPNLLPWTRLARVSAVRAIAAAQSGQRDEAVRGALLPVALAHRMLSDENATLVHAAVAYQVGRAGLVALEVVASRVAFDAAASRETGARLLALVPDAESQREVWAAEYRAMRRSIVDCCDREQLAALAAVHGAPAFALLLPSSYLYQPNNSLKSYATRIRLRQVAAGAACQPEPNEPETVSRAALLLPNYLGRLNLAQTAQLAWFDAQRCAHATHIEAVRAALALRAFEAERGMLPPGLEGLAPQYLESAPRDWFSELALRLDRSRRVIYSVGSDGRDDGGRELADDEDFREPRFPLLRPGEAAAKGRWARPPALRELELD